MTKPRETLGAVWRPGNAPISVVMISLNEAHNMVDALRNLEGFAYEVFLVDSYSCDETVDIAVSRGVRVVQRRFRGFGDQWNFAMRELPLSAPWTMKLDPDERLSAELKDSIVAITGRKDADAFTVQRRLWFMGRPLPVTQTILRGWRTGRCQFSDVLANEHPLVEGRTIQASGYMEHYDSPDLHHWLDKQNRYTTLEAFSFYNSLNLSAQPRFSGSRLERRMWLKKNFRNIPFRYALLYFYNLIFTGAWRAGWLGHTWALMRVAVRRSIELKLREMQMSKRGYQPPPVIPGKPHPEAIQASE